MRHRKWLDVVKYYDYEILYHSCKANVVADTLNRRVVSTPIQDMCIMMTVMTVVLEKMKEAQLEARNEEYHKSE